MMVILLCVYFSCLFTISYSLLKESYPFNDVLDYYEVVPVSHFRHNIISRNLHNAYTNTRQVHFYCLGRSFGLHLKTHRHLFSHEFKALLIDSNGDIESFPVDVNSFYIGHVIGDDSSLVITHISESGVLTAHIKTCNETYYIEPARLHLPVPESHDDHMLVYRKSDVHYTRLSDSIDYILPPPSETLQFEQPRKNRILKRQDMMADTCTLILVADYKFYSFMRSSESNVITTMVSRIADVDALSYRPAEWIINAQGNTITGLGLQIGRILIHTELSSPSSHYNSEESGQLDIQNLLRKNVHNFSTNNLFTSRFSRGNWSDFCLAHLITHRKFPSGKLGLAYIASPDEDETGGICSDKVIDSVTRDVVNYNTGLSVVSSGDTLLLADEAEIVIAHEIGHSWGSPHDPGNNPDCTSRYLMNEFAQDSTEGSHRIFSPCSLLSIGRVLNNKASCFEVRSTSDCGNFMIDEGEECDGGRITVENKDPCCNDICQFRSGVNCSHVNHLCCTDCQIASVGSKVCHVVGNISRNCTVQTTCNGMSRDCPDPLQAPVESKCLEGICMYKDDTNTSVRCVPYCELEGLEKCECTGSQRCLECCMNATGINTCQPLLSNGDVIQYPDGVFCDTGFCFDGICEDQSQDFASQLWSVITGLNVNEFAQFMRENIVGSVLIISLLFWIPGSCLFHFMCDVKQLWKKCFHRHETDNSTPAFVTQTSWTQVKLTDLKPLLSVEEDEFEFEDTPVDEPEDDMPLPDGYSNS